MDLGGLGRAGSTGGLIGVRFESEGVRGKAVVRGFGVEVWRRVGWLVANGKPAPLREAGERSGLRQPRRHGDSDP